MNRLATVPALCSALALVLAACDAGSVIPADGGPDVGTLDLRFPDGGKDPGADLAAIDGPDAAAPDAEPDAPVGDAAEGAPDAEPPADGTIDAAPDVAADAAQDASPDTVPDATFDTPDAGPDVPAPEETVTSKYWDRIERFRTGNPGIVPDPYNDTLKHADTEVVTAFGAVQPGSDVYLLHSAQGWDAGTGRVVVLLHGAGTDANRSFAAPDSLSDASMLKTLAGAGLRVFAVTFPHPFGNNENQAIVLAEALKIVRARTGAAQVGVVAHSKSGLALLAYLKGREAKWGAPFAGDIDRALFLGAPLGGMDWSFRHPGTNYTADVFGLAMPSSWDQIYEYFQWKDVTGKSIYAASYLGLQQALRPWRDTYPLYCETVLPAFCNPGEYQDWLTTYEGGKGLVSHSRGILEAMTLGGNWMHGLDQLPAPKDVAVTAFAGNSSFFNGVDWEASGPADGMVFEKSALDVSAFEAAGAPVLKKSFPRNHWQLLFGSDVLEGVVDVLK